MASILRFVISSECRRMALWFWLFLFMFVLLMMLTFIQVDLMIFFVVFLLMNFLSYLFMVNNRTMMTGVEFIIFVY